MNIEEKLKNTLGNFVESGESFSLSAPENITHGDYATNIAFILSKRDACSPKESAGKLLPILKEQLTDVIEDIEVAGPGFINFKLKADVVRAEINRINNLTHFETKFTTKKILVEHSSPNLFKPFHIGHLMNNIVGEAIVRMMHATNAHVNTISFPSDISLGIAKAIYIIKTDGGISYCKEKGDSIITYLGESYVRGVAHFDEHPSAQEEIKAIAQKLYSATPSNELDIYEYTKKINIEYFTKTVEKLGTHFDELMFESNAGTVGETVVRAHTPAVFTESEGAIVYIPEEERKDINTAVFINSQGHPTYEAKDVGLIEMKFTKYNSDYSFFVTDTEQSSHFRIVLAAVEKIHKDWAEKSVHITHGRMTFKGAKMSSRLGGVPLLTNIVSSVMDEVKEREGDKTNHLSNEEKNKLHHDIALASLRFAILRSKLGSNVNFDPDTSLSFEGDSGPYLQYTYARTQSLIAKGKENNFEPAFGDEQISNVEKKLLHFEAVAKRAIEEVAPQYLVTYLTELAQEFNSYYGANQIVKEGEASSSHRLAITHAVGAVLKRGLSMLAIVPVERM